MAKRNHISVEIDATFGSSFQEEVALRMLDKHIVAWREFFAREALSERRRLPHHQCGTQQSSTSASSLCSTNGARIGGLGSRQWSAARRHRNLGWRASNTASHPMILRHHESRILWIFGFGCGSCGGGPRTGIGGKVVHPG